MIINHKLTMDLTHRDRIPQIDVMQDDQYSRNLEIRLMEDRKAFTLPEKFQVLVRYEKPDRTTGTYDTLPDGTDAWSSDNNRLMVAVAPQVCTTQGLVSLIVTLISENAELSSFPIQLFVHPVPGKSFSSENYFSVTHFIPQPDDAQVGQYLSVAAVDAAGNILKLAAVPAPDVSTDATLQVSGAPADAQATGTAIEKLSGRVTTLENSPGGTSQADTLVTGWYNTSHQKMNQLFQRATSQKICTIIDCETVSTDSVMRFRNAMSACGIRGTYAAVTSNFASDSNLKDILLSLERDGFQVALHGYALIDAYQNPDSSTSLSMCEDDFVHGIHDLHSAGFTNYRYWVYPCEIHDDIQYIARKWGMEAGVAVEDAYNTTDGSEGRYYLKAIPLNERDSTGPRDPDGYTSTLESLMYSMEEAAENQDWVIILTRFDNWADDEYSRLQEAVEYAAELGYEFMTLGEAWNYRKAIYELNEMF